MRRHEAAVSGRRSAVGPERARGCRWRALAGWACCAWLTVAVAAQTTEAPADDAPPPDDAPASLDELLGIDEAQEEDGAREAADRESEEELQRQLTEREISGAFAAALEQMSLSADLLDDRFDAGLGTQRIQEDVLRKLDQLIDLAKKMQSSGSSSSSSRGKPEPTPADPVDQRNERSQPADQRNPNPSDSQQGNPPPRQDGELGTVLEESRTEWGGLPPRDREELIQGRNDKYSNLYERLTSEYYRRLAEEGSS